MAPGLHLAMEWLKILKFSIIFACLLSLILISNGEELDEGVVDFSSTPMKRDEKEALYSAIQGFVGKWWNGSDLYPDPCGWTPIQGVSCDLFDGFWYVTELAIGPVHDNSLSCNESVEFAHQMFDLMHLRTLSFFSCFLSISVSIPAQNWEALAGSLQSLEFRSNPGLMGRVPEAFGQLKNLQSLVLVENSLTGELPSSIGNLTNLRRLNLAGNSFTGRIPDTLSGLNHLLILDVGRNLLTGILPDSIGGIGFPPEAGFKQQSAGRENNPRRVWEIEELDNPGSEKQQIIRETDQIPYRTEFTSGIGPVREPFRGRCHELGLESPDGAHDPGPGQYEPDGWHSRFHIRVEGFKISWPE